MLIFATKAAIAGAAATAAEQVKTVHGRNKRRNRLLVPLHSAVDKMDAVLPTDDIVYGNTTKENVNLYTYAFGHQPTGEFITSQIVFRYSVVDRSGNA